ncbi:phage tail protein [Haloechinothrix alba]|uniref:phage tail protein n=1 Tax=Haloechinothrix alba TaxID=664784 RepID=UPI0011305B98|nr:hypothetical protein [Haloechinothrix alba]
MARSVDHVGDEAKQTRRQLAAMGATAVAVGTAMKTTMTAVGVAVGALPAIIATAGTAMVGALGGAITAVGVAAAATNKEVRNQFSATKNHIVSIMKDISSPFEGTLTAIARMARDTFDTFAPELEKAFAKIAPVLTTFSHQFFKAFEELKPVIQPVADAFVAILKALGPKLPDIMRSFAGGITAIARAISEDGGAEAFARLIKNVATLAGVVLRGIAVFIRYQDEILGVVAVVGTVVAAFTGSVIAIGAAVGAILTIVVTNFGRIKSAISGAWNFVVNKTLATWNWLKANTIESWNNIVGAIVGAKDSVLRTVGKLPGEIERKLGALGGLLVDAGKDLMRGLWRGIKSLGGWLKDQLLNLVKKVVPGPVEDILGISSPSKVMATMGRQVAQGLAQGIMQGGDLVSRASTDLARAATVRPDVTMAAQHGRLAAGGGRRGKREPITLVLESSGSSEDDELLHRLRKAIHVNGGNVQKVLGP